MGQYPLADRMPVGAFMVGPDFRVEFWNECMGEWTGIKGESVVGTDVRKVFPRLAEPRYRSRLDKVFKSGMPVVLSWQLNGDLFSSSSPNHPGRILHCTIAAIPVRAGFSALFTVEDMTESAARIASSREEIEKRKEAEAGLRKALAEKQVLMTELNHRVKNNLNMIRSLIVLQEDALTDPASLVMYRDLESRIATISQLHEMMYKSDMSDGVMLDQYLGALCARIFSAFFPEGTDTSTRLELEPVSVSGDIAVHVGLVVSELLTNAIKYGIKGRSGGMIRVGLFREENGIRIEVADDGPGLPPSFDPDNLESLGMKLVYRMTAQFGGRVGTPPGDGARFTVSIPVSTGTVPT